MTQCVAGIDGCPAGWLIVVWSPGSESPPNVQITESFAGALALQPQLDAMAIDIPIGLPAAAGRGGRACDVAARAVLGKRQSAVFAVPARVAVMQTEFTIACLHALANSEPPRKVSKQCYNIFSKMRDVDTHMSPELQRYVIECHPELAFWAMNGEEPLVLPKKIKSSPNKPGLALRRRLLRSAGFPIDRLDELTFRRKDAGPDDLIDACACAWTAARRVRGEAKRFPDSPPHDERGLAMEIWA